MKLMLIPTWPITVGVSQGVPGSTDRIGVALPTLILITTIFGPRRHRRVRPHLFIPSGP
jgi:hypothetical protein